MRVLFAGSPAIAVPTLLAVAARHRVVGILTNPESARGRSGEPLPTDVARAAMDKLPSDTPILGFERLDAQARERIGELKPDILVSFAYGKLFGHKFLSLFPRGGLNVHPSLLPRHRGSSPIQQAILDRDAETGVCVQGIALEMDSGDIYAMRRIKLEGRETAASLSRLCANVGAELAAQALAEIEAGTAAPLPQFGEPTYCRKIEKDDGRIDWTLPAASVDASVRAFDPWPGSFCFLRGKRLNILECEPILEPEALHALPKADPGTIIAVERKIGIVVRTGGGALAIRRLQLAGKKALSHAEFANGVRDLPGDRLE